MRQARSQDTEDSLISDESDLASKLSHLRAEVFTHPSNSFKQQKRVNNGSNKNLSMNKSFIQPGYPLNKLSMDDITTPITSSHQKSFISNANSLPSPSPFHNRQVVETEQMGKRLTEEIQRLRYELKSCKESYQELSSRSHQISSESESWKEKYLQETQALQEMARNHSQATQECERYKLELVSFPPSSSSPRVLHLPTIPLILLYPSHPSPTSHLSAHLLPLTSLTSPLITISLARLTLTPQSTQIERNNLLEEKYNLIQEKLKVFLTEKEVLKEKYDLQIIENERLKEKVSSFLPTLSPLHDNALCRTIL